MAAFNSQFSYYNFAKSVRGENRYIFPKDVQEFLHTVAETSGHRRRETKSGAPFWRAQLGHAWRTTQQEDNEHEVPCAYSRERMKPLLSSAKEGRANPKGIPYLYLATDRDTAMA